MSNQSYEPLHNLSLRKSNEMVSAKYKSTLLENQVMAVALTRIEADAGDVNAPLFARLYPGELKSLIGDPAHIYRTLKTVSKTMIGHMMFMEDQKGNFRAHAIVTDATYENGVFTVKFNESLRSHILGLEKNYTTLELSVLTDLKRNASFRIYELLKKEFYKSNPKKDGGKVEVEYKLSEFRFMIGIANADDPGVKNEMARMGNFIDWDVLYEKLDKKDRKYEKWYELVRNVIIPAQNELREKSNIIFDFEGIRRGRKIDKILFSVYPNDATEGAHSRARQQIIEENKAKQEFLKEQRSRNRQLEMPMDSFPKLFEELVGHNKLTKQDIELLLQKADYDDSRVLKAVKMADEASNTKFINNYMGWIVSCIERGWDRQPIAAESIIDGEKVVAIVETRQNRDNESLAIKVWEKIKEKDDFVGFVGEIARLGMEIEQLEVVYTKDEMVKAYTDWKLKRGINL